MRKHKIIPNHKKKPYFKPVITVIKLDPQQALLAACKSNGAYFAFGTFCVARPGIGRCRTAVRGHTYSGIGGTASTPPT